MRPLLLRLATLDRRLLALGGGATLATLALIALLLTTAAGGDDAAEDVAASPTATATPAFVLAPLPAGCFLLHTMEPGPFSRPPIGEPAAIVIEAQDCVSAAWRDVPLRDLAGELTVALDPPDGPAELLVPLTATVEGDRLRWRGTVTFPLGGNWRGSLRIAGQPLDEPPPLVWQVPTGSNLTTRPGLPLPALEYELTVLNLDRPGEPARWPALESGGMAWIPGAVPGEAARVVWVQAREGRDWAVAGDPTTGVVTPLFEVEMPVSIHGAPDGRAFVVVDRPQGLPQRIRLYDAERSKLVDVAANRLTSGPVSWAPDSSAVLIGGELALLLASDGRPLPPDDLWRLGSTGGWSPDSRSLLAVPWGGSGQRLLRVEVGTGKTTDLLADVNSEVRPLSEPAFSPDGRRFAVGWADPADGTGGVAVFDRDEPPPLRLKDHTVVSYRVSSGFSKVPWLTGFSWSPDGASLIVDVLATGDGGASYDASRLEVVDIASKTVRQVVEPREGHYAYGAMWVSADGRALFKVWHTCVGCDGGRSGLDVIDLASGAVVRTIEGGYSLGTIDGVRHLLWSPDGLLSVRGLEAPRALMPGTSSGSTSFAATPSPDGNRIAVRQTSGRASPVIAVAPDGSTQAALGYVRPEARLVGLRDAVTAFLLDFQAGWSWSSFVNGAVTPLPQQGDSRPEAALETAVAFSPDRSVVGYWVPGATKPEVTLQLLDLKTGAVASSVATSSQTKGLQLAMSPDGKRVAFPDNDVLVMVDVPTKSTQHIPLQRLQGAAGPPFISTLTHSPGGTFEVVAGGKLWRLDPLSGVAEVVTDQQPSPGGWRGMIELSRSPDGQRLVSLTSFGLFELQANGSWRLVSGVGVDQMRLGVTSIVWSPDSRRVAYLGVDGSGGPSNVGIVVAGLDGSGAYELVRRPAGREMELLDWLPDGRIVYAVITNGL